MELEVDQGRLPEGSLGNVGGFTGGLKGRVVGAVEKVQAIGSNPDSTAMSSWTQISYSTFKSWLLHLSKEVIIVPASCGYLEL